MHAVADDQHRLLGRTDELGSLGDLVLARGLSDEAVAIRREHRWQIELPNEVFTPSEAEVDRARQILQAMEDGAKEGKGAVSLDGRLIDAASIRMAQNLVSKVEQMQAR